MIYTITKQPLRLKIQKAETEPFFDEKIKYFSLFNKELIYCFWSKTVRQELNPLRDNLKVYWKIKKTFNRYFL